MKKLGFLLPFLFLLPLSASAQLNVQQGGTGTSTIPSNWFVVGSNALRVTAKQFINLATDISGILGIANGGTASSTPLGGILVGNGSGAIKSLAIGTNLTFDGTTLNASSAGSGTISTSTALSSGQVDFSTGVATIGNDSNFFWDNTNKRLGIGTTSPWAQLSVNPNGISGPAFAVGSSTNTLFTVGNSGRVTIATTTSNSTALLIDKSTFSNGLQIFDSNGLQSSLTAGSLTLNGSFNGTGGGRVQNISGVLQLWGSSGGVQIFNGTGSTANLTVTDAGLVGIGTTTPSTFSNKLFVNGSIGVPNNTVISGVNAAGTALREIARVDTSDQVLLGNAITITASGVSTLLLTGNPTIQNQSNGTITLQGFNGTGQQSLLTLNPTATVFNNAANATNFTVKASGAASAFFVQGSNGNVGIGTTTPSSQFTVASTTTATTTVDFGDQYSSNSHACFNTKNTAGTNVSFYFVGTTQVIEANRCR